jgi:hypothetical protein
VGNRGVTERRSSRKPGLRHKSFSLSPLGPLCLPSDSRKGHGSSRKFVGYRGPQRLNDGDGQFLKLYLVVKEVQGMVDWPATDWTMSCILSDLST